MTTMTPETSTSVSTNYNPSQIDAVNKAQQLQPIDISTLPKDQINKIVQWTNEQYTKIKSARTRVDAQWRLNLAFYYGKQYSVLTNVPGMPEIRLATPNAPYWRARPVFNRIRPIIRTEIAKCTAQKPTAEVVPASADEADLFAAQAAEQIWESMYSAKRIDRTLREAIFWTLITGTGFMKIYWDDAAVDEIDGTMGDICITAETPFHVFVPDFRIEDIEKQPFVIHVSVRDAAQLNITYAHALQGKEITPNVKGTDDILSAATLDLSGQDKNVKDGVLVYEVWIKPGTVKMFPNGAMFTVAGDRLLQAYNGWPYEHKQYPFVKLTHIPKGQFYSESTITDLISVQREYNRTRAQIIEAKNRMAKPQLMAPVGSIDASKMTTEPGQIIFYRPGFAPPTPLQLQPLPNYVLQELDRLNMEFDDISGQHEVSRGGAPSGVTAATAINYLQEQDDSKLSHTIAAIEAGIEKMAKHAISFAIQFWDTPRTVRVVGSSGSFDTLVLKGSDLAGNTDIRVQAGSALPTSKAAKQAFLMDLMKMGFIDPNKGLELMELGGVNRLYEELRVDERQAQRENLRMQTTDPKLIDMYLSLNDQLASLPIDPNTGEPMDPNTGQPVPTPDSPIPVNTFDDHQKHIEVHNKFRKSQAFEGLSDQHKQLFELHVRSHVAGIMQSYMPGGNPAAVPPEMQDPNAAPGGQQQNAQSGQPAPGSSPGQPNQAQDTLTGDPAAFAGGQLPTGG